MTGSNHNIEKLIRPEVRGEPAFGDDVVGQTESQAGGDNGVGAVSDIGKGTAVNKSRRAFQRLNKIRPKGVPEQRGHGPRGFNGGGGDGFSVQTITDYDPAQAGFEIGQIYR